MGDLGSESKFDASPLQMRAQYRARTVGLTRLHLAPLLPQELMKPRQTKFGFILHTLAPIDIVDQVFRGYLEGRMHEYTSRHIGRPIVLDELQSAMLQTSK